MAQPTPNTMPNAPKAPKPRVKRDRAARKPRAPRLKLIDLHDTTLDPRGRVDVLVARGIKLMVAGTPNPIVQTLYGQLQPVVDAYIQKLLGGFNVDEVMAGGSGEARGARGKRK